MTIIIRKNAWNNNGTFDNPDLFWYAKGVGVMQSRQLNDPTSWWFFAAIHGQTLTQSAPQGTLNWADVPGPPVVPTAPLPSQNLIDQYWDQCQHGTWYFPPWHRGYLYAIENILRETIQHLGGPDDWALPYWNYFGPDVQYKIPPAFRQQTLPDGSSNPLFVIARYGLNHDGNVSIPVSSAGLDQECQRLTIYTGVQPRNYGGGATGFNHNRGPYGALEYNPHGGVHVAIGGQTRTGVGGLMSRPATAALDPVFYLHHSNIDRMWATWIKAGNNNPTEANWLNGPTAQGNRKFYMPKPDKTPWPYTPAMVNDVSQVNYTYEDLSPGVTPLTVSKNALRLRNFGLTFDDIKLLSEMSFETDSELVGANGGAIEVDATGARTAVRLDSKGWNKVAKSLTNTFRARLTDDHVATSLPDQVYLQLEGIKGKEDSIVCSVSVNQQYVGNMYLFGLSEASMKDAHHGGAGLTIRFDISKIADELHFNNDMDLSSLDVLIQPVNIVAEGNELSIDRVSVYRESQI